MWMKNMLLNPHLRTDLKKFSSIHLRLFSAANKEVKIPIYKQPLQPESAKAGKR